MWGVWGPWSGCSQPCGEGVRKKARLCIDYSNMNAVQVSEKRCMPGTAVQTMACVGQHCNPDFDHDTIAAIIAAGAAAAMASDAEEDDDPLSDAEDVAVAAAEAKARLDPVNSAVLAAAAPAAVISAKAKTAAAADTAIVEAPASEVKVETTDEDEDEEMEEEELQLTGETIAFIVLLCILVLLIIIAFCIWFSSRYQDARMRHELSQALPFYSSQTDGFDDGYDNGGDTLLGRQQGVIKPIIRQRDDVLREYKDTSPQTKSGKKHRKSKKGGKGRKKADSKTSEPEEDPGFWGKLFKQPKKGSEGDVGYVFNEPGFPTKALMQKGDHETMWSFGSKSDVSGAGDVTSSLSESSGAFHLADRGAFPDDNSRKLTQENTEPPVSKYLKGFRARRAIHHHVQASPKTKYEIDSSETGGSRITRKSSSWPNLRGDALEYGKRTGPNQSETDDPAREERIAPTVRPSFSDNLLHRESREYERLHQRDSLRRRFPERAKRTERRRRKAALKGEPTVSLAERNRQYLNSSIDTDTSARPSKGHHQILTEGLNPDGSTIASVPDKVSVSIQTDVCPVESTDKQTESDDLRYEVKVGADVFKQKGESYLQQEMLEAGISRKRNKKKAEYSLKGRAQSPDEMMPTSVASSYPASRYSPVVSQASSTWLASLLSETDLKLRDIDHEMDSVLSQVYPHSIQTYSTPESFGPELSGVDTTITESRHSKIYPTKNHQICPGRSKFPKESEKLDHAKSGNFGERRRLMNPKLKIYHVKEKQKGGDEFKSDIDEASYSWQTNTAGKNVHRGKRESSTRATASRFLTHDQAEESLSSTDVLFSKSDDSPLQERENSYSSDNSKDRHQNISQESEKSNTNFSSSFATVESKTRSESLYAPQNQHTESYRDETDTIPAVNRQRSETSLYNHTSSVRSSYSEPDLTNLADSADGFSTTTSNTRKELAPKRFEEKLHLSVRKKQHERGEDSGKSGKTGPFKDKSNKYVASKKKSEKNKEMVQGELKKTQAHERCTHKRNKKLNVQSYSSQANEPSYSSEEKKEKAVGNRLDAQEERDKRMPSNFDNTIFQKDELLASVKPSSGEAKVQTNFQEHDLPHIKSQSYQIIKDETTGEVTPSHVSQKAAENSLDPWETCITNFPGSVTYEDKKSHILQLYNQDLVTVPLPPLQPNVPISVQASIIESVLYPSTDKSRTSSVGQSFNPSSKELIQNVSEQCVKTSTWSQDSVTSSGFHQDPNSMAITWQSQKPGLRTYYKGHKYELGSVPFAYGHEDKGTSVGKDYHYKASAILFSDASTDLSTKDETHSKSYQRNEITFHKSQDKQAGKSHFPLHQSTVTETLIQGTSNSLLPSEAVSLPQSGRAENSTQPLKLRRHQEYPYSHPPTRVVGDYNMFVPRIASMLNVKKPKQACEEPDLTAGGSKTLDQLWQTEKAKELNKSKLSSHQSKSLERERSETVTQITDVRSRGNFDTSNAESSFAWGSDSRNPMSENKSSGTERTSTVYPISEKKSTSGAERTSSGLPISEMRSTSGTERTSRGLRISEKKNTSGTENGLPVSEKKSTSGTEKTSSGLPISEKKSTSGTEKTSSGFPISEKKSTSGTEKTSSGYPVSEKKSTGGRERASYCALGESSNLVLTSSNQPSQSGNAAFQNLTFPLQTIGSSNRANNPKSYPMDSRTEKNLAAFSDRNAKVKQSDCKSTPSAEQTSKNFLDTLNKQLDTFVDTAGWTSSKTSRQIRIDWDKCSDVRKKRQQENLRKVLKHENRPRSPTQAMTPQTVNDGSGALKEVGSNHRGHEDLPNHSSTNDLMDYHLRPKVSQRFSTSSICSDVMQDRIKSCHSWPVSQSANLSFGQNLPTDYEAAPQSSSIVPDGKLPSAVLSVETSPSASESLYSTGKDDVSSLESWVSVHTEISSKHNASTSIPAADATEKVNLFSQARPPSLPPSIVVLSPGEVKLLTAAEQLKSIDKPELVDDKYSSSGPRVSAAKPGKTYTFLPSYKTSGRPVTSFQQSDEPYTAAFDTAVSIDRLSQCRTASHPAMKFRSPGVQVLLPESNSLTSQIGGTNSPCASDFLSLPSPQESWASVKASPHDAAIRDSIQDNDSWRGSSDLGTDYKSPLDTEHRLEVETDYSSDKSKHSNAHSCQSPVSDYDRTEVVYKSSKHDVSKQLEKSKLLFVDTEDYTSVISKELESDTGTRFISESIMDRSQDLASDSMSKECTDDASQSRPELEEQSKSEATVDGKSLVITGASASQTSQTRSDKVFSGSDEDKGDPSLIAEQSLKEKTPVTGSHSGTASSATKSESGAENALKVLSYLSPGYSSWSNESSGESVSDQDDGLTGFFQGKETKISIKPVEEPNSASPSENDSPEEENEAVQSLPPPMSSQGSFENSTQAVQINLSSKDKPECSEDTIVSNLLPFSMTSSPEEVSSSTSEWGTFSMTHKTGEGDERGCRFSVCTSQSGTSVPSDCAVSNIATDNECNEDTGTRRSSSDGLSSISLPMCTKPEFTVSVFPRCPSFLQSTTSSMEDDSDLLALSDNSLTMPDPKTDPLIVFNDKDLLERSGMGASAYSIAPKITKSCPALDKYAIKSDGFQYQPEEGNSFIQTNLASSSKQTISFDIASSENIVPNYHKPLQQPTQIDERVMKNLFQEEIIPGSKQATQTIAEISETYGQSSNRYEDRDIVDSTESEKPGVQKSHQLPQNHSQGSTLRLNNDYNTKDNSTQHFPTDNFSNQWPPETQEQSTDPFFRGAVKQEFSAQHHGMDAETKESSTQYHGMDAETKESSTQYHVKSAETQESLTQNYGKEAEKQESSTQFHAKDAETQESSTQYHGKDAETQESLTQYHAKDAEIQENTSWHCVNRVQTQKRSTQLTNGAHATNDKTTDGAAQYSALKEEISAKISGKAKNKSFLVAQSDSDVLAPNIDNLDHSSTSLTESSLSVEIILTKNLNEGGNVKIEESTPLGSEDLIDLESIVEPQGKKTAPVSLSSEMAKSSYSLSAFTKEPTGSAKGEQERPSCEEQQLNVNKSKCHKFPQDSIVEHSSCKDNINMKKIKHSSKDQGGNFCQPSDICSLNTERSNIFEAVGSKPDTTLQDQSNETQSGPSVAMQRIADAAFRPSDICKQSVMSPKTLKVKDAQRFALCSQDHYHTEGCVGQRSRLISSPAVQSSLVGDMFESPVSSVDQQMIDDSPEFSDGVSSATAEFTDRLESSLDFSLSTTASLNQLKENDSMEQSNSSQYCCRDIRRLSDCEKGEGSQLCDMVTKDIDQRYSSDRRSIERNKLDTASSVSYCSYEGEDDNGSNQLTTNPRGSLQYTEEQRKGGFQKRIVFGWQNKPELIHAEESNGCFTCDNIDYKRSDLRFHKSPDTHAGHRGNNCPLILRHERSAFDVVRPAKQVASDDISSPQDGSGQFVQAGAQIYSDKSCPGDTLGCDERPPCMQNKVSGSRTRELHSGMVSGFTGLCSSNTKHSGTHSPISSSSVCSEQLVITTGSEEMDVEYERQQKQASNRLVKSKPCEGKHPDYEMYASPLEIYDLREGTISEESSPYAMNPHENNIISSFSSTDNDCDKRGCGIYHSIDSEICDSSASDQPLSVLESCSCSSSSDRSRVGCLHCSGEENHHHNRPSMASDNLSPSESLHFVQEHHSDNRFDHQKQYRDLDIIPSKHDRLHPNHEHMISDTAQYVSRRTFESPTVTEYLGPEPTGSSSLRQMFIKRADSFHDTDLFNGPEERRLKKRGLHGTSANIGDYVRPKNISQGECHTTASSAAAQPSLHKSHQSVIRVGDATEVFFVKHRPKPGPKPTIHDSQVSCQVSTSQMYCDHLSEQNLEGSRFRFDLNQGSLYRAVRQEGFSFSEQRPSSNRDGFTSYRTHRRSKSCSKRDIS
ncbi:LOW QUALITY PROTEIN: hypothetical protein PoB_003493300 [Plakobranchus ocellatus]|uniref:Uncharacterized protein n=1 Tax=Plakobranchus ocellatus TaxID=259542 RepID=A0AAV4APF4_9GAST|nr:LOW QUALITY PROTEIN: hypothetical protein PoB_003493300 [Plakobranchus ocellatus]